MDLKAYPILPTPKTMVFDDGTVTVSPCVYTDKSEWLIFAKTLADTLSKITMSFFDIDVKIEKGGVTLVYDATVKSGAYVYEASDDGVSVRASDDEGLCYGIATVAQVLNGTKEGTFTTQKVHIEDFSDKPYRAVMLDLVSRWHPVSAVLKLMDVCFMVKVPFVHMHLIDNEACRIPSKAFPDLATPKYSYSYDDIKTMREYANARGLKIIPEFDIPGHARRLVTTYPEVFGNKLDKNTQVEGVKTEVGATIKTNDVVCAGSKECMDGMKKLFAEVCELFPESEYIHIGGDEAYIQVWDHCPECQKYMKENGVSDRYEMYSDYVGRISRVVLDLGRTPIVWEGFPRKGSERVPKETIVIAWETHYNMPRDLLDDGFKIINGSWQPLYIVGNNKKWTEENVYDWSVYNWQHWWEHSEARLNPIWLEPTDDVLGAQISLWGTTYEQEICGTMENLGALSERAWNTKRLVEYKMHHSRAARVYEKVSKLIMDI